MGYLKEIQATIKRKEPPPTVEELDNVLGRERVIQLDRLKAALEEMGFNGGLHWYGPLRGWAFRFRDHESVICSFHLTGQSNEAIIEIGSSLEPAIMSDLELSFTAQNCLVATPRRESGRRVKIVLSSVEAEEALINLASCKKRALKHPTDPWPQDV